MSINSAGMSTFHNSFGQPTSHSSTPSPNNEIRYTTFDGQIITFTVYDGNLDMYAIGQIGQQYANATREIPTHVYLGINYYRHLGQHVPYHGPGTSMTPIDGPQLYMNTPFDFGIAKIIPVMKPSPNFVLVGQEKDYNRYIAGDILEKELLT